MLRDLKESCQCLLARFRAQATTSTIKRGCSLGLINLFSRIWFKSKIKGDSRTAKQMIAC
jgi:hypothetical protein